MDQLAEAKEALKITDIYSRDEIVKIGEGITPPFWPECGKTQFKMVTRILKELELTPEVEGGEDSAQAPLKLIEVEFTGKVRCIPSESKDVEAADEVLSIEVKLGLLYTVTQACSPESLEAFVRINVPYHAVPYWREQVHAACARRRFPPITVPLYSHTAQRMRSQASSGPE
ncbi:hypothetical protein [Xanthomonas phaseoli]|uniref:hypothetical protein n=1 Tax=Xanthomonas phaseoli TaxID=1985254 RepID=UPI001237288C|nr:hypothetical protein [Xanthomonas phaseoli]MBO9718609.1 hypothetical protein [Xanthomonas phaseoli pv. manihotis]